MNDLTTNQQMTFTFRPGVGVQANVSGTAKLLLTYADKKRVASDARRSLPCGRRYHCISAWVGRSLPNNLLVIAGAVKAVCVILAH
jgi:hypothetical protein